MTFFYSSPLLSRIIIIKKKNYLALANLVIKSLLNIKFVYNFHSNISTMLVEGISLFSREASQPPVSQDRGNTVAKILDFIIFYRLETIKKDPPTCVKNGEYPFEDRFEILMVYFSHESCYDYHILMGSRTKTEKTFIGDLWFISKSVGNNFIDVLIDGKSTQKKFIYFILLVFQSVIFFVHQYSPQ